MSYGFILLKIISQKTPSNRLFSVLEYDEYDEDEEYTEALEDIADEMNQEI